MNRWIWMWMITLLIVGPVMAQQTKPTQTTPNEFKTDKDKTSYVLGLNLAKNLQAQKFDLNYDMVLRGLKDGLSGNPLLKDEEMQAVIKEFYNSQRQKKIEEQQLLADADKKEGTAFMETNRKTQGVVTLPSGIQYRILTPGTGPKPKETDRVKVNYVGRLVNGTEFDSSYKRNQPAVFPVTGVIKGWTEVLQLMPVGSKWSVVIPPELAYGMRSVGDKIGPNSTLIFEIDLVGIEPASTQTQAQ